jgi:putative transposase
MVEKYKNRIEPNRWQYWNYSSPGDYFITIIIQNRDCILGEIVNTGHDQHKNEMILSDYGKIVETEFSKINNYHKRAKLNECIIMPNHIHLILTLLDYNNENDNVVGDGDVDCDGDDCDDCDDGGDGGLKKIHEFSLWNTSTQRDTPQSVIKQNRQLNANEIKQYRILRRNMLVIKILGKFKQQTSKQINILRNTRGTKNWQRDFHDHVIRNNAEYQRIKNYIINNPQNHRENS